MNSRSRQLMPDKRHRPTVRMTQQNGTYSFAKPIPRCEADVVVVGKYERNWRKNRNKDDPDWMRCTRHGVVTLGGIHLCSRHGGEQALAMVLNEPLPHKKRKKHGTKSEK